jgi:hypothetical protein
MRDNKEVRAEQELEDAANALLRSVPPDPHCPIVSESQFMRLRCEGRVMCLADVAECVAGVPDQTAAEEWSFLLATTRLSARERACLQGWIQGRTQESTGAVGQTGLPPCSQQTVSNALRRGVQKCLGEEGGLTFREFNRHTIYRPAVRRERARRLMCPHCGERFRMGLGCGRFCCSACREAARRT